MINPPAADKTKVRMLISFIYKYRVTSLPAQISDNTGFYIVISPRSQRALR